MRLSAWQKSRIANQVRGRDAASEDRPFDDENPVPMAPATAGGFHVLEPQILHEGHRYQFLHTLDPRATHHPRMLGGRHR